ncbi:MAG: type II secretion system protein N, partial [Myxococcota bacterium]
MLGSVLRSMAYSTYFTVALVAFLYLSIPTGQVKRYVAHQATKNLKKKVTIGGLDIRGVSGVTLTDVRVELPLPKNETAGDMAGAPSAAKTPGSEADAEENDEPPPLFNPPGLIMADKIDLDVNTWGLVNGKKLKAVLNAELSGGTLSDVKFEAHKSGWTLEVGEMAGVDLTPMRVLRTLAKIEMDLHGRLSGRALIEWAGELQNSKADLELQLTDALIPYLPIKHPTEPYPIGEAFQVAIGDVELRMKLDKAENLPGLTTRGRQAKSGQVLLIEELKARGEHVEIQLDSGQRHTISFRSPKTSEGIIDVRLVVHFTDEFFAWKGDGVRSDGHEAKDVGHSALKSAMDSFLKHA